MAPREQNTQALKTHFMRNSLVEKLEVNNVLTEFAKSEKLMPTS